VRVADEYEIVVLDLDAGEIELVDQLPCGFPGASISADGATLVYRRFDSCPVRPDGRPGEADPTLVVRDLETGTSTQLLAGEDQRRDEFGDVRVSPDGSRVSLYARRARQPGEFIVVDRDGIEHTLDVRRFVGGVLSSPRYSPEWVDEDHLLARYSDYSQRYLRYSLIVVFDANDGSVTHEFVIPSSGRRIF